MSENKFKVRSRLLEGLGEQLIKDKTMAFEEIIKNAYDSDASVVTINMINADDKDNGQIVIEDNGCGMDLRTIQNIWLEAGTDNKDKTVKTAVYKRRVLGEKGLGRFAVNKLGNKLKLVSREDEKSEVCLFVDWDNIEHYKYIDEIPIEVSVRPPEIFSGKKTGTRMIISSLKNKWTYSDIQDLYQAICSFINPFNELPDFRVEFKVNNRLISNNLDIGDILKDHALYYVYAELEGNSIVKFYYRFRPYHVMTKIRESLVDENDKFIKKALRIVDKNNKEVDLSKYKIGKVKFSAYIYDSDPITMNFELFEIMGVPEFSHRNLNMQEFQEYLTKNSGIKVYRDNMRIYNYGEPDDDWLEINRGLKTITYENINNCFVFGAIELDREQSDDLIEISSREGFVENDAYLELKSAMLYLLKIVENQIGIDRREMKSIYYPNEKPYSATESFRKLKDIAENQIEDESLKKDIISYVSKTEKDYESINEVLLKAASLETNVGYIAMEINSTLKELSELLFPPVPPVPSVQSESFIPTEPLAISLASVSTAQPTVSIPVPISTPPTSTAQPFPSVSSELKKIVTGEKPPANDRIAELVKRMIDLTDGYFDTLKRDNSKPEKLINVIGQVIFNLEFRLKSHNVTVDKQYKLYDKDDIVNITRSLVICSMMNIIDNSIWWLRYPSSTTNDKKIFINIVDKPDDYISIVIADNGCGFGCSSPEIFTKPFVTSKPYGEGIGLGLHIVSETMVAHGGMLLFPKDNEIDYYCIPDEYKSGAKIVMAFRKHTQ
jgi:signal transduction histidine kinase